MISPREFTLRAALCRQLAEREPDNAVFWMSEAKNWSRQSKEKLRGGAYFQSACVIGQFYLARIVTLELSEQKRQVCTPPHDPWPRVKLFGA